MLKINLLEDEDLRNTINSFVSALLPHNGFDSSMFNNALSCLLKYIHLDEFQMEHRLLLEALVELNRIKISMPDFEPRLEESVFEKILESSIFDAIVRPELGVTEWLTYEGLNNDLRIQTVREEACQKVCARALELYEECFSLEESTTKILNHEPELRAAFIAHTGVQCINLQSEIIRHEARIGRKKYCGYEDWLEYTRKMVAEIDERLANADGDHVVRLDSVEGSYQMLKGINNLLVPIANYGIPELDAETPILRHRLVVVVGKENIGKTKFAVDQTVNVLRAGGKVVYMCGETEKSKVFAAIMINFIYKEFGMIIRNEHLVEPELCPDDVRKAIGMAIDRVVREGGLTLCDSFNYATLRQELDTLYETSTFDMVVIDHSCALVGTTGSGSLKDKIDKLAYDCRDFKKANPVCVMVTSHPSLDAKDTAKRDKTTVDSPTKGSQNLSTEADEVFYIRDNDALAKQGLVMLENTKRRDAERVLTGIIFRKRFEVSAFEYDPSLQSGAVQVDLNREAALDELEDLLNSANDTMYSLT